MNEKILEIKDNIKSKIFEGVDERLNELANEMFALKRDNKRLGFENTELRNKIADRRDTLEEFMERYIAHNTVVTLWDKTSVQKEKDGPYYHKHEKLWSGMDWQIAPDYEESAYFYHHPDVEPCPYTQHYVEEVIGNPEERGMNTVDSIHLVIRECKYTI